MNEQVGWRGLVERLKKEAPHYAQLLPELPRLLHQALQPHRGGADPRLVEALLLEQRRTNRLLRALLYAAFGFVLGLVATQFVSRWVH
jgi:ubiquinone biosynthesis protein